MRKTMLTVLAATMAATVLLSSEAAAQRRRAVVRVRHPRAALIVRPGHPIRRVMPAAVVVRPARRAVIVSAPLVFLPAVAWSATVVSAPPRERLLWQDSETIESDDGWVDTNYGIDASGDALYLDIGGRAQLNFAEVTFANGNVQVVDFNEKTHGPGLFKLLDFSDGRHVKTVRVLAQSRTDETKLSVYLAK
jgi:hypothetical protein